jgi:hypothetical protein
MVYFLYLIPPSIIPYPYSSYYFTPYPFHIEILVISITLQYYFSKYFSQLFCVTSTVHIHYISFIHSLYVVSLFSATFHLLCRMILFSYISYFTLKSLTLTPKPTISTGTATSDGARDINSLTDPGFARNLNDLALFL